MQEVLRCPPNASASEGNHVFHKVTFSSERGYVVEYVSTPNGTVCSSWLLLPGENLWPEWIRGCLYLIALLYIFIGIAIVSDLFMGSIEVITSQKRKVTVFDPEKRRAEVQEILVWNETVANLTLMALGSSAPEIMLAILESVQKLGETREEAEQRDGLGAFTIVGSAAFNLLIITAVCILSVPSPHLKRVSEFGVFLVTTTWSLFAYLWLLIVLEFHTPGVVEMWEAWLTLIFFPLFVLSAWAQDNNWWKQRWKRKTAPSLKITASVKSRGRVVNLDARPNTPFHGGPIGRSSERRVTSISGYETDGEMSPYPSDLDDEIESNRGFSRARRRQPSLKSTTSSIGSEVNLPQQESRRRHSLARARLRHAALRSILGGSRRSAGGKFALAVKTVASERRIQQLKQAFEPVQQENKRRQGLHFSAHTYSVLKASKGVKLHVTRSHQSNERRASSIPRQNVGGINGSSNGFLRPQDLPATDVTWAGRDRRDTPVSLTTALIDELDRILMPVSVQYETRDGSAKQGVHYQKTEGVLTFREGDIRHSIHVPLKKSDKYTPDDDFYVILKNPSTPGALSNPDVARVTIIENNHPGVFEFDSLRYYGDPSSGTVTATVTRTSGCDGTVTVQCHTIDGTAMGGSYLGSGVHYERIDDAVVFRAGEASKQVEIRVNGMENLENKNFVLVLATVSPGAQIGERSAAVMILAPTTGGDFVIGDTTEALRWDESWESQFQMALSVGEEEDEDGKPVKPSRLDYILHFVSIFWKVLFATVPPRSLLGGWPAFLVSLLYIGACTAVVEQVATLFGCVIGLRTSVTGITLVAFGTSLPDTFASRSAAVQEKDADAAIGNITGSNSVNVFLGLGLPWVISACYYSARDQKFHVSRFNLPFSVVVFTGCAIICITLLITRRLVLGGELGGQKWKKWLSSGLLLFLWCLYVLFSSLRAYDIIPGI